MPSPLTPIAVIGFERESQTIAEVVRFGTQRETLANLISEKKISNSYSYIQGTWSVYSHLTMKKNGLSLRLRVSGNNLFLTQYSEFFMMRLKSREGRGMK